MKLPWSNLWKVVEKILLKWIKVLVVEPGKMPEIRELPNNLKAFELTIRGYVETVQTAVHPDCLIVYDGNYPLSQKPEKRSDITGTFIIIRVDPPEPVSLNEIDIKLFSEIYK